MVQVQEGFASHLRNTVKMLFQALITLSENVNVYRQLHVPAWTSS